MRIGIASAWKSCKLKNRGRKRETRAVAITCNGSRRAAATASSKAAAVPIARRKTTLGKLRLASRLEASYVASRVSRVNRVANLAGITVPRREQSREASRSRAPASNAHSRDHRPEVMAVVVEAVIAAIAAAIDQGIRRASAEVLGPL